MLLGCSAVARRPSGWAPGPHFLYHPRRLALPPPPEWPLDAAVRRVATAQEVVSIQAWVRAGRAPAFRVESEPVGPEETWWSRTFKRNGRPAALPLLASKFGGRPYLERPHDWPEGYEFLGQIDFGSLPEHLPHLPRRGLLSLFLKDPNDFEPVRLVWYDAPHESKAAPSPIGRASAVRIESRLHFHPIWIPPETLNGRAYPSPEERPELSDAVLGWTGRLLEEQGLGPGQHLLGPPLLTALTDQFRADELAHLATILRLESDPAAGLELGERLLYLMVAREDLEVGRLGRGLPVWAGY